MEAETRRADRSLGRGLLDIGFLFGVVGERGNKKADGRRKESRCVMCNGPVQEPHAPRSSTLARPSLAPGGPGRVRSKRKGTYLAGGYKSQNTGRRYRGQELGWALESVGESVLEGAVGFLFKVSDG